MSSAPSANAREARTRVLIVDDSAVARAALSRFVASDPAFEVAAAAPDASRALDFLSRERVDVILLDLEMPRTSGIGALPKLIAAGRGARVLVVSSAAADGAAVTMRALTLGAADTLVKPAAGAFATRFGEVLMQRLALLTGERRAAPAPRTASPSTGLAFDAIAIGASTGGIHALASLFQVLPAAVQQPIFITQHLPSSFSPFFAEQVALSARRRCDVAADRAIVREGQVYIAPGTAHLTVQRLAQGEIVIRLTQTPTATGNMPSVDPMFASLAEVYGSRLLAITLSGMGRDGLDGARAVHAAGGALLVQDQASSVVWGMPGAIAGAGLARAVMSPQAIGSLIAASVAVPA
ncbi:chemotaxis-specific protein-glutamate methyltransferase CheB [Sphingomonas adhaesiva]|uniref:chemotaxis-specific protein-glutamate methyltransferase CheB n=1 Tax=Sphingomonas adhaesiva TaxID=28212 RepID=UPI002FF5000E